MGYSKDIFITQINHNLLCAICKDIFEDPVCCPEGHTFCNQCITDWVNRQKVCPLDRKKLYITLLRKELTIKNIIDELKVKCCNLECAWNGTIETHLYHIGICPLAPLTCDKCSEIVIRKDIL